MIDDWDFYDDEAEEARPINPPRLNVNGSAPMPSDMNDSTDQRWSFLRVSSSCCGLSLRRGAVTVGIAVSVIGGVLLLMHAFGASRQNVVIENIALSRYKSPEERDLAVDRHTLYRDLDVAMAVLLGLLVIINLSLVIGANRGSRNLVLCWIWCFGLLMSLIYIGYAVSISLYFKSAEVLHGTFVTFAVLLSMALFGYFFVVVFSYYKELEGGGYARTI